MSYNDVILEGTIIAEPIFYQYLNGEKMELKLLTLEGTYTDKDGKQKRVKSFHKVLVYNQFYIERARKDLIQKNGKAVIRGKLASMVDSDGCYSYCVCVVGNHHYLKVSGNYFTKKTQDVKKLIKNNLIDEI
jgi:hypothetical protein